MTVDDDSGHAVVTQRPNLAIGCKVLATLDNWFYAPDGQTYRAVFGTVRGVFDSQSTLGVRTNAKSTNWYIDIGNVTVAGCQIHYVVKCDNVNLDRANEWVTHEGKLNEYDRPSSIYDADSSV